MPSKSPKKPLSTATDTELTDSNSSKPTWDTSPVSKPRYLLALSKWLPDQDERYRILIETGATSEKSKTIVMSDNHMDRHRHSLLPVGTFATPTLVTAAD